ncbi:MAG: alpha-mannosidase, partial [Mycobacterium leprae]
MADNKIQVYMYHHTHWDREWWTTFQNFRFRLVHIVDQLLDILDADPSFSFTLDGQTIVLKDYLEVRPENEERLLGYIRAGRLGIGPWHILPDEYLVSGEAHIRNLWLGERTARQYGVVNNKVGYLPDQFGHISQMPQILAGFGIDAAVVWRGFGAPPVGQPEGEGDVGGPNYYAFPPARNPKQFPERTQSEFWWEAPDGTRVMGVYLPLEYYQSHFADFPGDSERTYDQTVGRCRRTANYLRAYATTDNVLQPYGGDHLPADPRLPELLQTINRELEGDNIEIKLALLGDFVRAVQAENPDLQVVWKGEGRAFGRKAYVLPGVASTRIYIKQLNRDNQVALERYAEPYQALRWMLGGKYEHNYLWLAWERLIQNHPHDSISGCSIDQVHREMITRFDESKQLADLLAFSAQEDIAGRVDMGNLPEGAQPIVVFNPLNWSRTDEVRINLNPYFEISPNWWVLRDAAGNEVPFQAQDAEEPLRQFAAFYDWLPIKGPHKTGLTSNACTTVTFVAKDVPPLGYASYYLEKRTSRQPLHRVRNYTVDGDVAREKGAAETTGLRIGPGLLENEYLQVTVDAINGSLTILDKATGHTYCGLNQFRDGGDAGDTYNYSWPMGDQVLTTACVQPRLTWVEYGPIKATLRVTWPWSLPESLTADRESRSPSYVPVELHSDITLYPGVKRVDVKTHFNNRAKDHRLQALFPFGSFVCRSHAEGQFDVVSRPTRLPENERGSSEPAVYEVPQQTFISVSDGVRGLTIANKGLPEAAVYDDAQGTVAITLLRAVGWVSREDFLARTGGAGPTSPTPDAQMLGEVVAEYAIVPHGGTWNDAKSYRQAHDFNAPLAAV